MQITITNVIGKIMENKFVSINTLSKRVLIVSKLNFVIFLKKKYFLYYIFQKSCMDAATTVCFRYKMCFASSIV